MPFYLHTRAFPVLIESLEMLYLFVFNHVFIPKPDPTFGRHALALHLHAEIDAVGGIFAIGNLACQEFVTQARIQPDKPVDPVGCPDLRTDRVIGSGAILVLPDIRVEPAVEAQV